MWNGRNGDLYIGICPISYRSTYTHYLRIERSGGAISRNPKVVSLLTELYKELAQDDENSIDYGRECLRRNKQKPYGLFMTKVLSLLTIMNLQCL